jgi:hypothetical protein
MTLEYIDLGDNGVSDDGAAHIASMLAVRSPPMRESRGGARLTPALRSSGAWAVRPGCPVGGPSARKASALDVPNGSKVPRWCVAAAAPRAAHRPRPHQVKGKKHAKDPLMVPASLRRVVLSNNPITHEGFSTFAATVAPRPRPRASGSTRSTRARAEAPAAGAAACVTLLALRAGHDVLPDTRRGLVLSYPRRGAPHACRACPRTPDPPSPRHPHSVR